MTIAEVQASYDAELEAHRAACRERHCLTCGRSVCSACGAGYRYADVEVYGAGGLCRGCVAKWLTVGTPRWTRERGFEARILELVGPQRLAMAKGKLWRGNGVIFGKAKSGKTGLASEALYEAARCLHRPLRKATVMVSAMDLACLPSETPFGQRCELVDDALSARVLAIEDLGWEEPAYPRSAVARVIESRFRDGNKRTIFTTPLDARALAARYPEHIIAKVLGFSIIRL